MAAGGVIVPKNEPEFDFELVHRDGAIPAVAKIGSPARRSMALLVGVEVPPLAERAEAAACKQV